MKSKFTVLIICCFLLAGTWLPGNGQIGSPAAIAKAQAELEKCIEDQNEMTIRINNLSVLMDSYIDRVGFFSSLSDKEWEQWQNWLVELRTVVKEERYACNRVKYAQSDLAWQIENSKATPTPTPAATTQGSDGTTKPQNVEELKERVAIIETGVAAFVQRGKAKLPPAPPIDGLRTNVEWQPGVQVIRIETPKETITVSLPDDIRAGDTISGTVYAEPKSKETGRNETRDAGAPQIEINRINTNGSTEYFRVPPIKYYLSGRFTDASGTTGTATGYGSGTAPGEFKCTLTVVSPEGQTIRLVPLETNSEPPPTGGNAPLKLPELGQAGRNQSIIGRFDGIGGGTDINIGGKPVEIIAESPRQCTFRSPSAVTGLSEITVNENGRETRGPYRNLSLNLTAPKTNLLRGEKTTLTVQVSGLEGIRQNVPLLLEKTGTVTMQDGDVQHIQIRPGDIDKNGVFSLTRGLTGVEAGGFNVTATVYDPTRRPIVIPLILNAGMNGYRVTGTEVLAGLNIVNVIDPLTGKPLDGTHRLRGGCQQPALAELPVLRFLFKNGNAGREKTNCVIFVTPRIIVTE